MKLFPHTDRRILRRVSAVALAASLTACATSPPAALSALETLPGAMTVPYEISDAGHLILDIGVNGSSAKPFLLDTGANISAVYQEHAASLDLVPTEETVPVNGLVSSGPRPVVKTVDFEIGQMTFLQDYIIILDRLKAHNDAVGLLGVDVLSDYILQFNRDALTVTFIESDRVGRGHFVGWRQISLENRVGGFADSGLYFASMELKGDNTPVLIDTGSEVSIINWPLATLDPAMKKVRRKIRDGTEFEGAIESFPLQMRTVFFDVALGAQTWPEVPVVIMNFDSLTTIAPADEPLMIAGAGLFTPSNFAFDFKNNMIYIRPENQPLDQPENR